MISPLLGPAIAAVIGVLPGASAASLAGTAYMLCSVVLLEPALLEKLVAVELAVQLELGR